MAAAQEVVTALRKPAPASHFDPINGSHLQDLSHLANIDKQATDPEPIVLTITIPIPDVTPLKVPQYALPRVPVSLVLSSRLLVALPRMPGSHLE